MKYLVNYKPSRNRNKEVDAATPVVWPYRESSTRSYKKEDSCILAIPPLSQEAPDKECGCCLNSFIA